MGGVSTLAAGLVHANNCVNSFLKMTGGLQREVQRLSVVDLGCLRCLHLLMLMLSIMLTSCRLWLRSGGIKMSEHTPTTEEVRNGYIRSKRSAWQKSYAKEDIEFDRWLAGVQAEAWKEGYVAGFLQAMGGELAQGAPPALPPPTTYALQAPLTPLVTLPDVAAGLPSRQHRLVDARAAARYRGDTEPLDPVAGHVPGALNRPFDLNFTADGRFKDAATLRAEWQALLGNDTTRPVVLMCGSGVSAVPNLLAMEIAGLPHGGLFAGSWSEWCRQPEAPCATGDAPG